MIFSFSDVEAVLARMHDVTKERRSAFTHRIKHLQRLKFPPGTNTGRGRAAVYLPRHVILLSVMLELNQMGLLPDRAVKLCLGRMQTLQSGVTLAMEKKLQDGNEAVYVVFDPVGLADLREPEFWDEAAATFIVPTHSELKSFLGDNLLYSRRNAIINLTAVFDELGFRLSEVAGVEERAFAEEIRRSAGEEDWLDGNS